MVAFSRPVQSYASSFFSFKLQQQASKIKLQMQFPKNCTTTKVLPHTYSFLKKNIPSILQCQCYNDDGLPFRQEVKHTELAHLFEHILLDQLCQEKSAELDAEYSGQTEWDWNRHPVGSFKVTIGCAKREEKF